MTNKDQLQRFIFGTAPVRGEIVHLDHSYQTIVDQHLYPPIIRHLLGEALTVVSLLSALLKFKGKISLQFQGKGCVKLLLAQCNESLHIRGVVQHTGDCNQKELSDDLSQGTLAIIMDPEVEGGQRYQGIVAWEENSLAKSVEGYFRQSEQIPTRLWLSVNETKATGLLLQIMPEDKVLETDNQWEHLLCLTETITSEELLTLDNETLLYRLYSTEKVSVFPSVPIEFRCNCSVKRSEQAILLLGKEEAEEELARKQKLVVTCEFCNKEYLFDRMDITTLFLPSELTHSLNKLH